MTSTRRESVRYSRLQLHVLILCLQHVQWVSFDWFFNISIREIPVFNYTSLGCARILLRRFVLFLCLQWMPFDWFFKIGIREREIPPLRLSGATQSHMGMNEENIVPDHTLNIHYNRCASVHTHSFHKKIYPKVIQTFSCTVSESEK